MPLNKETKTWYNFREYKSSADFVSYQMHLIVGIDTGIDMNV